MNKYSFYRPHERVYMDTEILDPVTGELVEPPSMTKQEFQAECDINNILKQYKRTGMVSHINAQAAQGRYVDLADPVDFQDAMHLVIQSENSFASLPSKVRERFNNDPAKFLEFMADPDNQDEMVKLGLATKPTPPPDPAPTPPPEPPTA